MGYALGIDVGSTNAKVAIVDPSGRIHATAARPVPTRRDGETAGQDPDVLWLGVTEAIREATAAAPEAAAQVSAVGVCSQYSSIVGVDAGGRATTEVKLYLDHRGTDHCWEVIGAHDHAFQTWLDHHGIPPIGSGLSMGHLLHFQLDRPEAHAQTVTYLEVMDFVNLRLTGRAAATQASMFAAQVVDNRTLGVTRYDDELLELSGIDADRLPPLIGNDEAVGPLLPAVATELGLPATATVVAAINDSQAGAIATGALEPGRAGVMIGTTSVLLDTTPEKRDTDLDHEVLSMPSPIEGHYLVWAENGLGGKALEHVLEHLVHAVDELADHATDDQFARLDAALRSVPAGSDGVLFHPWLAGSFSPKADTRMRGGFLNLSLDTRRTHLVRAVVEGIGHNLAWLAPYVEAFSGTPIDEVVFGGGAARSPVWAGMLADILQRPVRVLTEPDHANARAVGLLALHRCGVLSLDDLAARVDTSDPIEPDERLAATYRACTEQFVASFEALRPVYHALNG